MKDFLIYDSDGQELFDALHTKFVASVEPVGNFSAVVIETDDFKFCGGVYDDAKKSQQEVNQLLKAVTKARRGKNNFEGYELGESNISATELLDSIFDRQANLQTTGIFDDKTAELLDTLTENLLALRCADLKAKFNL